MRRRPGLGHRRAVWTCIDVRTGCVLSDILRVIVASRCSAPVDIKKLAQQTVQVQRTTLIARQKCLIAKTAFFFMPWFTSIPKNSTTIG